ncbi:MAG TPA: hypothetical protein VD905_08945 [Flavobacteriales bacterium]|nr:hypothetical protein [Flavobacteriales bacterium]
MNRLKLLNITACFFSFVLGGCKPGKKEIIRKAKESFITECNNAAKANPGAGHINFEPYCSCAWDKLMVDKKFEEMVLKGDDHSPEAMEYANEKIKDPAFKRDLESCKDNINL